MFCASICVFKTLVTLYKIFQYTDGLWRSGSGIKIFCKDRCIILRWWKWFGLLNSSNYIIFMNIIVVNKREKLSLDWWAKGGDVCLAIISHNQLLIHSELNLIPFITAPTLLLMLLTICEKLHLPVNTRVIQPNHFCLDNCVSPYNFFFCTRILKARVS